MRNLSFRSVLIAAAVGFFALGILTTLIGPDDAPPAAPASAPTASPSPAITPSRQISVLILGVDSFEADSPRLEAVWLAALRPPESDVFLFGFPVDRTVPEDSTLEQAFAWSDGPSDRFLAAFSTLTPLPIDVVVALDSSGFAAVIDFLGGVPTDGQPVDGASALNILRLLRDDPGASLLGQARLLQALAARAGEVRPGSDLQPLLDLVPTHARVRPDPEAALTLIAPALPLAPERIHLAPLEADAPAPD
jgi:hypothetical protein